jgi:hypothetical protein
MSVVIVSGALANKPGNAGGAWERMSWVTGLLRLGCDVYFVEQIDPAACVDINKTPSSFAHSVNLAWFRDVTEWFGISDRAGLIYAGRECAGIPWTQLLEFAEFSDLLVNLSGHLALAPMLKLMRRKAYIDVDPGFTQFWHADTETPFHVDGHDFYFTVGENLGRSDCTIPKGGVHWRSIRQPVVLDQWPVVNSPALRRFTTVASWRGALAPVRAGGRTFGVKLHEFRKFFDLPQRVPASFEIALDIHPADQNDRSALDQNGWRLVDPRDVAGDPDAFRGYIQGSGAEFSVAQGIYVETNSGWFSDRSTRYLASGKPVLLQETGFSRNYPAGEGLVAFRTPEEAAAGAERIIRDYDNHCRAARALAEEYFNSDKVLGRLLEEAGVSP